MRRALVVALLVLAIPAGGQAQAPRITTKGDPSVRDDSLYRLAVNPADHPNEDMVLLLDDGVVTYEQDGTGAATYRQVIQLLTDVAAENFTEQSFSWNPDRQRLRVNWIRVVGLDGRVISAGPSHSQVSDVPAAMENPVYGEQKVQRVSMSGVRAGTIIDFSVTTEELKPFLPGDFLHGWRISTGRLVRRSRYILDVPAAMPVRIAEHNLTFAPEVRESQGRKTWVWAIADVPPIEPEPFAADSNGVVMHFDVAGATSWEDIGRWYGSLARDRYLVTPDLKRRVKEIVDGAQSREDTVRRVHRWVAQEIRYVSITLGLGGYQPRKPSEVLATGFGDCKDKATLFIAMLESLGMPAYPVLLSAGGDVNPALPSLSAFDHVIVGLPAANGYEYVDLTSDLTPFGELPPADQGQFGLLVRPAGAVEQVRLPLNEPIENLHKTVIVGELDSTGLVRVQYEESGMGTAQYSLRQALLTPLDSTRRANFIHELASGVFSGSAGDNLEVSSGKDLAATPLVRLTIRGGRAAKVTGRRVIFTVPFGNMGALGDVANQLEAAGTRRFPIDVAQLLGPVASTGELRLTMPEGWEAELPPTVRVDGPWGSYLSEYQQVGRELTIRRVVVGRRGYMAPDTVGDLIQWLRNAAKDDTQFLVISR